MRVASFADPTFKRTLVTAAVPFLLGLGVGVAGLLVLSSRPTSVAQPGEPEKEPPPLDVLKFVDRGPGEGTLETALISMARADGLRVDLIGAVHVADEAYYRDLEKRFEEYDSVLYEMIKPEDVVPAPGEAGGGALGFLQRTMKTALGLQFQLDAIDYRKPHFVHADLDPETFFRLQKERGESLLSLLLRSMAAASARAKEGEHAPEVTPVQLAIALSSPDSARSLKYLLATELQHAEKLLAGIEGTDPAGKGTVIVSERNRKALDVLEIRVAEGDRHVAIFYGAGHLPDLERRARERFGLRRRSVEWLTAWTITAAVREQKAQPDRPRHGLLRGFWGSGDGRKAAPEAPSEATVETGVDADSADPSESADGPASEPASPAPEPPEEPREKTESGGTAGGRKRVSL